QPIMYFHGWPTSKLDARRLPAQPFGQRIIAVDRAGFGLSDFCPGRQLVDWPSDVVGLANALGLDRFGILGVSGGGPYAAACAAEIPDRLTGMAIVGGLGPLDA